MPRCCVKVSFVLCLAWIMTCAASEEAVAAAESESPVRLETLITLAAGPEGETPEQAKARAGRFDREIDRLLDLLTDAGGKKLKPPVRMSGLPFAEAAETVNGGFAHTIGQPALKSVRSAIVVAEPNCEIQSVENSIVIFPSYGNIDQVRNSIVLARYRIDVRHAGESIILSGFDAKVMSTAANCVCGAREMLWLWYPLQLHEMLFVNSKLKFPKPLPDKSRAVQVEGLDLTPARDLSLDDVVTVTATAARKGLSLFRTSDGKGEYVAHRAQAVLDPDGKPLAALDGWQLESVLDSYAVFVNHGRRAVLPVVSAPVSGADPLAKSVRLPPDETKPGPVRLETLIRLATGPDGETPEEAKLRAEKFDHEIDRLLVLLSHGSRRDIKPPVRMSDLPAGEVAESVDGCLVRVQRKQGVKSARKSIVVLERGGSLRSVENCIVIVTSDAGIGYVENSVVLARYDVSLSARNSVVLSGLDMFFVDAWNCVCGAHREMSTELGIKQSLIVNTQKAITNKGDNSRAIEIKGLELARKLDKSLDDIVDVTCTVRYPQQFALLRTKDGKGEYVARYGQPILDPDGRPIAELDGWWLEHAGGVYVVFVKGGRYAELRVPKP